MDSYPCAHMLSVHCYCNTLVGCPLFHDDQVAIAVETKKKAVMDRHLDLIVGQTERYSKMLASNLLLQQQGKYIDARILQDS